MKIIETILIAWALAALAAVVANSAFAGETEGADFIALPQACEGVLDELDLPDDIRVQHFNALKGLPHPEVIHAFIDSVDGLETALLPLDSLDRDTFYVRVHVLTLDELQKTYSTMDSDLLVRTRRHACRQSLRGSDRRRAWPAQTGGDEPQSE